MAGIFLDNRCPIPQQAVIDMGGEDAFGNGSSTNVVFLLPLLLLGGDAAYETDALLDLRM